MKIDCFTHVMPPKFLQALKQAINGPFYLEGLLTKTPELSDLDKRLCIMDELEVDYQVLTPSSPPIEVLIKDPQKAYDLARLANDEIAEMAARHPKRFLPVGMIAMNNMEKAPKEAERAIKDLGMKGLLIYTSADGVPIDDPSFFPFYETMAKLGYPIWLHPSRGRHVPDYPTETVSKYAIWQIFGWPYETTVAMTRLVFSGVFDRYPDIAIITHHAGAMVPFLERHIDYMYRLFGDIEGLQENLESLSMPVLDYFRKFYGDTALNGSVAGLLAAYSFFGHEKLLFGTDSPFDTEGGKSVGQATIESMNALPIPPAAKAMMFSGNARRLFHL
jgi:aminocarboxymuconate-semialdehyde decarboxylase